MTDEIARLAKTGPTAAELARAKTKQRYNFVTGLERIGGFGGKADLLNQYNTFLGAPANSTRTSPATKSPPPRSAPWTAGGAPATASRAVHRRSRTVRKSLSPRGKETGLGADAHQAPEVKTANSKTASRSSGRAPGVRRPRDDRDESGAIGVPKARPETATEGGHVDLGTKRQWPSTRGGSGTSAPIKRSYARRRAFTFEALRQPRAGGGDRLASSATDVPRTSSTARRKTLDALGQQSKNANAIAGRFARCWSRRNTRRSPVQGLRTRSREARGRPREFNDTYWKPGVERAHIRRDVTLARRPDLARGTSGLERRRRPCGDDSDGATAAAGKLYLGPADAARP